MKKIIVLVIALLVGITAMAYLYFSKLGLEKNAKDLALQSATNNAAIVFSFQNDKGFYEIIKAQNLIQQVLGNEKIEILKLLKQTIVNDNALNKYIHNQQIYISILPDSNKNLNFLVTVQLKEDEDLTKFHNVIKAKKNISVLKANLFLFKLDDSTATYANIQDRVITLSTSLKLINDAAVRLKENPFTEYIKTQNSITKSALAQVYINFNQVPRILKNILNGKINGEIAVLNDQNSFASLTYNFSKERIFLSGNTELKSEDNYLKLFEKGVAQSISIQNVLPENTANYVIYAFDDYQKWLKEFRKLQARTKQLDKAELTIKTIKTEYRTDLNTIFPAFTKNQFATFQLNTAEKLGAIQLINGEKVKQLLFDVSTAYNDDIKIFKSSNILEGYFGEAFKNFSRPYYVVIDNYLIVANNASTLVSFLSNYKNNRLLVQSAAYTDAMNQISSTLNVSFYINLTKSQNILNNHLYSDYYKNLRADSGLKSFDTFCYQMVADKNKFITNVLLNKYLEEKIPDSLSIR